MKVTYKAKIKPISRVTQNQSNYIQSVLSTHITGIGSAYIVIVLFALKVRQIVRYRTTLAEAL